MKAFLLAAGYGTRLRPMTDRVPKCLIPVRGRPLMAWWLDLFRMHGVSEVLVNTHHLPEQVRDFIQEHNSGSSGVCVTEFFEPDLLGSGGTVAANRAFIGTDESFLICYADNLTNIDLSALMRFHGAHGGVLSMALFRTQTPKQCGIAELDEAGRITGFVEKPSFPTGNLANAGIYAADRSLFDDLPDSGFADFGKDVLPRLAGRMYGWETSDYLMDIGTPENYRKAQEEWPG